MRKKPCYTCKHCNSAFHSDISHKYALCRINRRPLRRSGVTGEMIKRESLHRCWWFRHTPFCRYEEVSK